ncbi:helix-turn-helix domain-containing protein [Roseivivax sp.]
MSGTNRTSRREIRSFALYGESARFPDVLHCETISDRAAENAWTIRTHRHPLLHQLILIEEGRFSVWIDGVRREFARPVLMNVPPDHVHGFRFSQGMRGYVLSVPSETLPDICYRDETVLARLAKPAFLEPSAPLVAAFGRLHGWHESPGELRAPVLRAIACEILCLAASQARPRAAPGGSPRQIQLIESFETLLQAHLRERWRAGDYARALGVSPTHLTRICRAAAGISASAWIDRATVTEACRQLAYTVRPVSQISYDLGYEDPSHFSRVFRRVMGLSPSAYRG